MKYFNLAELTKTNQPFENKPNLEEEANLRDLVEYILDPLREAYGKPIIVNSGFRSEAVNNVVKGAKNSQHRKGMAADIRTVSNKPEDNKALFDLIQKLNLPWDQLINEYDFSWVHVSYDASRSRKQVLKIG